MVEQEMTIAQKQQDLIDEFAFLSDWTEKYEHIISLGKEMPAIHAEHKTEDNLIRGCQSRVWLHADFADGKVIFSADSDALITRGLISMIVRVFSGKTPQEIMDAKLTFIDEIGLKDHLSPTRSNGLLSMVKQIKLYALAYSAKS